MNSKKAKRLRKQVNSKDAQYVEEYRHSVWLKLPRAKDEEGEFIPWKIDWDQIKKHLQKIENPKWRGHGLERQLRYSPGIPIKLNPECGRAKYQKLKKEFNVA